MGHFELLEYVGGGGMGRVYRALDTRLGRTVALKFLSREQAANPETLMRFRNEARSAARLNHESIARVYYLGEDDGLPYIAFEFIEGINVRKLVMQRGMLPLAEALSYALQVSEALTHAASRNVVHRDIKPSNILITSDGQAKLIDMGLARMRKLSTSASDLTASGVTLGTFDYISPEQARDPRIADIRSDIYSLGCTLFHMLTGRPPFPEGTVLQKLLQHQEMEPPDVRDLRPELPEEVSRVVRKMMAKEPHRRYQDSSKLTEALVLLAEQIGLRPIGRGHTAWTAGEETRVSFLRRHVPWMAPVAVMVAAVILLQVAWTSPDPPTSRLPDSWLGEPGGLAAESSPLAGSALPGNSEPDRGETPPEASGGASAGNPPTEPASPNGGTDATSSSPDEATPASSATEAASSPQESATAGPIEVHEPNPMDALVLNRPSGSGLLPERSEGGLSLSSQAPLGLSVDPRGEGSSGGVSGSTGAPASPTGDGAPTQMAPQRTDLLVVDPAGEGEYQFATLSAACGAALSGSVIELRYDGRLEEEPLTLANLDLTIRAGEGFKPVVGFRPSEIDPIGYPRSMLTLIGSRLTLVDVVLELDMPPEAPSGRWSLVEIGQGEKVTLKGCWLTIRNASAGRAAHHQEVTFFRLKAPPGSHVSVEGEPGLQIPRVGIDLEACVVRGEAVFLRTEDLRPVRLAWKNGLLITTEQLLVAEGGERLPQQSETIEIDLEDLTAVADGGLCRLSHSEFAPYQLPAIVRCVRSRVLLTADVSLVDQVNVTDSEESLDRVLWTGEDNVYEGFTSFRTIRHLDPGASTETWTFDDWSAHNEKSSTWLEVVDQDGLPGPDRPVHTLSVEDYPRMDVKSDSAPPDDDAPPTEEEAAHRRRAAGHWLGG